VEVMIAVLPAREKERFAADALDRWRREVGIR
jgi:hypothetical protein